MAETRQSHERDYALSSPALTQPTPAPEAEDPRWVAARVALQATLSEAEFTTWIAPLALLHVEETLVVIGAPNCFVRSELQGIYASALEEALEAVWGRAITVEVVIELALAA
jgi:chromosomal replication initiation ATPase DnaA